MEQVITLELLTRKEAAAYLRICKSTLDKLLIPRIRVRRRIFYRKSQLEQWLVQNSGIKGA